MLPCRYCFLGIALSINDQNFYHIETSKLICKAYQLNGFYVMRVIIIKPFLAIVLGCNSQETPENLCFLWHFEGVWNGKVGHKWVNGLTANCFLSSYFTHHFSSNWYGEDAFIEKLNSIVCFIANKVKVIICIFKYQKVDYVHI